MCHAYSVRGGFLREGAQDASMGVKGRSNVRKGRLGGGIRRNYLLTKILRILEKSFLNSSRTDRLSPFTASSISAYGEI